MGCLFNSQLYAYIFIYKLGRIHNIIMWVPLENKWPLLICLNDVSITEETRPLYPCDGDVRMILPERPGQINIVFKPHVFNADISFCLIFENPLTQVNCAKRSKQPCMIDVNKEVYNVKLNFYRDTTNPTMVRIHAKGCPQGTRRTLHIPGTNLNIACCLFLR